MRANKCVVNFTVFFHTTKFRKPFWPIHKEPRRSKTVPFMYAFVYRFDSFSFQMWIWTWIEFPWLVADCLMLTSISWYCDPWQRPAFTSQVIPAVRALTNKRKDVFVTCLLILPLSHTEWKGGGEEAGSSAQTDDGVGWEGWPNPSTCSNSFL